MRRQEITKDMDPMRTTTDSQKNSVLAAAFDELLQATSASASSSNISIEESKRRRSSTPTSATATMDTIATILLLSCPSLLVTTSKQPDGWVDSFSGWRMLEKKDDSDRRVTSIDGGVILST